jgi:hypothetical protein
VDCDLLRRKTIPQAVGNIGIVRIVDGRIGEVGGHQRATNPLFEAADAEDFLSIESMPGLGRPTQA